jgi:hypothetical protein
MTNVELDGIIAPSRPVNNRVIFITIWGLLALDGSSLNGTFESHFTTRFDPFYSNAMRVRLIAGEFLTEVPDDTINQLVWYFSRQADLLNYMPQNAEIDPVRYASYRSRWATISTIVSLLSGTSVNGMMQKRLGDLLVKRDRAAEELYRALAKDLEDLTDYLEDGGKYGRDMQIAVKGLNHPDTPILGRLWARPDHYQTPDVPSANSRANFTRSDGALQRRSKRTFRDR